MADSIPTPQRNDAVGGPIRQPGGSPLKQRPGESQRAAAPPQTQPEDTTSLLKLYRMKQWLQNRLQQSQAAVDAGN